MSIFRTPSPGRATREGQSVTPMTNQPPLPVNDLAQSPVPAETKMPPVGNLRNAKD
jgi:hypothetical protein